MRKIEFIWGLKKKDVWSVVCPLITTLCLNVQNRLIAFRRIYTEYTPLWFILGCQCHSLRKIAKKMFIYLFIHLSAYKLSCYTFFRMKRYGFSRCFHVFTQNVLMLDARVFQIKTNILVFVLLLRLPLLLLSLPLLWLLL